MKRVLKSRFGLAMAGVYVLLIVLALIEAYGSKPEPMDSLGLMILTAPWSYFIVILLFKIGVITTENGDSFLPFIVIIAEAINVLILLFAGYLLTKLLRYLIEVTNRP